MRYYVSKGIDANVLNNAMDLGKRYGFEVEEKFDNIFIKTKFEYWFFEIQENGKIKLNHASAYANSYSQYHVQFIKHISLEDLFYYINRHQYNKYGRTRRTKGNRKNATYNQKKDMFNN